MVGLASAALGGAAVLGGQGLAQRGARQLEDQRWQRQREDRRQEERKQQYASLIAVLHAWQEWLDSTRAYLFVPPADKDPDPEVDLSEVRRHRETARQMLAVVELIAPTKSASLAPSPLRQVPRTTLTSPNMVPAGRLGIDDAMLAEAIEGGPLDAPIADATPGQRITPAWASRSSRQLGSGHR